MKGRVTFNWVKKALLATVASVGLFTTSSFAQQFHIGVTGGPQLTNLQSDLGTYKGKVGFNGGLAADWRVVNNFGLELDVLYSQIGAEKTYLQPNVNASGSVNHYTYKTTESLNYLQFILLPKLIVPLGSKPIIPYDDPNDQKIFLSFFAGPYFALRTGFTSSGTKGGYTVTATGDTIDRFDPITYAATKADADKVAPNDLGLTAGAGINFNMNKGKTILGFEGRYSRSLATIDLGYYTRQSKGTNAAGQAVIIKEAADIFTTAIAFNVSLKFRILGD